MKLHEMKKSTSLPLISKKFKILSEEGKKELLKFKSNDLFERANKIIEIKIYLKDDFHNGDIDNEFMRDIESEYAEKFLTKMELFPTKKLVQNLLRIKPIDRCDFRLEREVIYINDVPKEAQVMHIYPSPTENNIIRSMKIRKKNINKKINKKIILNNIESVIKFNRKKKDKGKEDIANIKKNNERGSNQIIFNKE